MSNTKKLFESIQNNLNRVYIDNSKFKNAIQKVFGADKNYKILNIKQYATIKYKNKVTFYINKTNKNEGKIYFSITNNYVGNKWEFNTSILDIIKKVKAEFEDYAESELIKYYSLWISLEYKDHYENEGYVTDLENDFITQDKAKAMRFDTEEQAKNFLNSIKDESFTITSSLIEEL